jgi:hypothetical protein
MALFGYLQKVQLLLRDVTQERFTIGDLTTYINEARAQVAGDGECIRAFGSTTMVPGTQVYPFSAVTGFATGVGGANQIRSIWYGLGGGQQYVTPKTFEWLTLYYLNDPLGLRGSPKVWAQFAQGTSGSFYIGPTPDAAYTLMADAVCYPAALVDDKTIEAIPLYWQDAVQFLASFFALFNADQPDEADKMYRRYELFRDRARKLANPSLLPGIWSQAQDVTLPAKLGVQQKAAG